MEMVMAVHKSKKKSSHAPLLVLTILLLASCEMTARGELVCDIRMPMCVGVCYKSGKCMSCCKGIGFHHGRCSFIHGMGCYCCEDLHPAAAAAAAARRNATAARPPPRP